MNSNSMVRRVVTRQETILAVILLIYCGLVSIINPAFLELDNLFDIIKGGTGMAILALGCLVVLISGGIDVSFTAVAISSGYIAIKLMIYFGIDNIAAAFLISGTLGLLLGFVNGIVIHAFGMPTLIVTLGTQNIFVGLLTIVAGTRFISAGVMPKCILALGSGRVFSIANDTGSSIGLSVFIVPLLVFTALTWFILNKTVRGRIIYAMGSSVESAVRAGINLASTRLFVYMYVGLLSGFMGIIYAAQTKSINPISLVGDELKVIAAVVLGGASLTGGKGTVLGTLLGVGIITVLNTTLVLIGLSASWNMFFVGLIITLSVMTTSYQSRRKDQAKLVFSN